MRYSTCLSAAFVSATASARFTQHHSRINNASTLDSAARVVGKEYVGVAVALRDEPAETDIIKSEFGWITPENAQKWEVTEPTQGNFSFEAADAVVEFAEANAKELRCHTLVWYSQLPTWVSEGGFDNTTLIEVMINHISTVVSQYKGRCRHWDVVNEALNEDGTYRDNVFMSTMGDYYIPLAFKTAAAADPDAELWYNDFNLETKPAKAAGAARIVQLVQSYGYRIDGVGLQAHLTVNGTATDDGTGTPSLESLTSTLASLTTLDVDVAYTELDIRQVTPTSDEALKAQGDAYSRVVTSCIVTERCVGITVWGVSDKYSWIPETFEGEGSALLWDEQFHRKSAYNAFLSALRK